MKYVSITFTLIALIVGALLYLYGFFLPIVITEQDTERMILVYEKHTGSYRDVGTVIEKIASKLSRDSIPVTRHFGIYYDNAQELSDTDLRSIVGCVIEKTDSSTLVKLAETFDLAEYKPTRSITAEFPYKNSVSILLAVLKVYPALKEYFYGKGYDIGPVLEIYDTKGGVITFITPTHADPEFYNALLGIY